MDGVLANILSLILSVTLAMRPSAFGIRGPWPSRPPEEDPPPGPLRPELPNCSILWSEAIVLMQLL